MLDGLLGRGGFSSKCKSLIKITRTRIDVTRRKRYATQKFLKQDIADLLTDGLESNAFGRAEGLIAEMCLTSCYDFIDHVCEIVLKHLSTMQKQGECPEDCREAVASLMFAAARFSDLPELRDLRNLFQERYGNSLEYFVNQKLVEHINPKPPNMEGKLKLLQDTASEFSVNWDSYAFEQRLINNAPGREDKPATRVIIHSAKENKYMTPQPKEIVHKIDTVAKRGPEATHQMKGREALKKEHQERAGAEDFVQRQRSDKPFHGQKLDHNKHKPPIGPKSIRKTEDENVIPRRSELVIDEQKSLGQERADTAGSSHGERAEPVLGQQKIFFKERLKVAPEIEHHKTASQAKVQTSPVKGEAHIEDLVSKPILKLPPYVKPNKSKHKSRNLESIGKGDDNDTLTFNPGEENLEPLAADIPHFTAVYYKDETSRADPTSRRRSRRRHKSSSSIPSDAENVEEVRVVRRVTTSRRRNGSKKGLQILSEDDHRHHHQRDTEERMMDELLLHYSKKPSGAGEHSEKTKAKSGSAKASESKPPSRSITLPCEQSSSEFKEKVFTRAVSFDQEASTPVKHVHPKLPDYDEIAARFAAMRSNMA